MATCEITTENFKPIVDAGGIVLLDFWAAWCGPCRSFAPTFEAASEAHPDIVFGKVDTEVQRELATAFEVRSIPTIAAVRDGVVVFRHSGALPASALERIIAGVRELDMGAVHADNGSGKMPD